MRRKPRSKLPWAGVRKLLAASSLLLVCLFVFVLPSNSSLPYTKIVKPFGRILLFLVFIPIFILFLLSTTIRFQVLNDNFWIDSWEKGSVYGDIVKIIIPQLQKPENDFDPNLARLLLTEANLQEFSERNIRLVLGYVNGRDKELKLFIPFSKLPRGFLPARFKPSEEVLTITEINSFMGGRLPLETVHQIPQLGSYATLAWIVVTCLLGTIVYLMYRITDQGKRLVLHGLAFIPTALLVIAFATLLTLFVQHPPPDLATTDEPSARLLWIAVPPMLQRVTRLWIYLASGLGVLGIAAFFIKKPTT